MSCPLLVVGCGAAKDWHYLQCDARDLYTGSLFRAARRHAEASGRPWVILSALHGLISPGALIAPYDLSMRDRLHQPPTELARYKAEVAAQVVALLDGSGCDAIEIHAGSTYAALLRALSPLPVLEPLAGLTIGRRLHWYAQAMVADAPACDAVLTGVAGIGVTALTAMAAGGVR